MTYAGQRAWVIGASGGIGQVIARELLDHGCDVALTYQSNAGALDAPAARAGELGRRCLVRQLDLKSRDAIRAFCHEMAAELGAPSILVNCAGVLRDKPLTEMDPDDWEEVLATNLSGAFYLLREAAPLMMKGGGGRIVLVASVSGLFGQPGQANYAASKGGLIAMTRALARELGPFRITVNALAPGVVETEMTGDLAPELKRRFLQRIPLRRFATPEDLVPAARLLMAPDGSYITGQVLVIDGGLTS